MDAGLAILFKRKHIGQMTLKRWQKKYSHLVMRTSHRKLMISGYKDDIRYFYDTHSVYFNQWVFESDKNQLLQEA